MQEKGSYLHQHIFWHRTVSASLFGSGQFLIMLISSQELTPNQITNLVWAISRASYNSPRTTALLALLTSDLRSKTERLSPAATARLLQSLATLSFYDETLFTQMEEVIVQRLAGFQPEELAHIVSAFVSLSPHNSSCTTCHCISPILQTGHTEDGVNSHIKHQGDGENSHILFK